MNELVKLERLKTDLAIVETFEEINLLDSAAAAMAEFAKKTGMAKSQQDEIGKYRIQVDSKKGEWLDEHFPSKGSSNHHLLGNKGEPSTMPTTKRESAEARAISRMTEEVKDSIIEVLEESDTVVTPKTLVKEFKKIVKEEQRLEIISKPVQLPEGVFNVVYADPPWSYENSGFAMNPEYPLMPTEDICELIPTTSANAVCFLWVTNPLLLDGMQVLKAWGFDYKTNIVWVKQNHTAGFYVFGKHELLLIGVKGSMLPLGEKFKSVIEGSNKTHSKKPDLVYEIIEAMYPNQKYLEMFARNKRQQWSSHGNQID